MIAAPNIKCRRINRLVLAKSLWQNISNIRMDAIFSDTYVTGINNECHTYMSPNHKTGPTRYIILEQNGNSDFRATYLIGRLGTITIISDLNCLVVVKIFMSYTCSSQF